MVRMYSPWSRITSQFRRWVFNRWYTGTPPWDTGISPPELLEFIRTHPPGRALDLGCGTGTNVICLAQHGWQVCGVDFAPRAIESARRKVNQAGLQVELRVEDVTRLPGLTGPFDLILDIGCFHSLPAGSRSAYLGNLERLLAPGGTFLLYVFVKDTPGGNGPGIPEDSIHDLAGRFQLIRRQDGTDRGRQRASAWLEFYRKP